MARINGVEIPNNKRVVVALTYIYGVGNSTAQKIEQQHQYQVVDQRSGGCNSG